MTTPTALAPNNKVGHPAEDLLRAALRHGTMQLHRLAEQAVERMLQHGSAGVVFGEFLTRLEVAELAELFAAILGTADLLGRALVREQEQQVLLRRQEQQQESRQRDLSLHLLEGWITLSSKDKEGEKHGSVHVYIGSGGHIEKGPQHMVGKKVADLKSHKVTAVHGETHPDQKKSGKNPQSPLANTSPSGDDKGSEKPQPKPAKPEEPKMNATANPGLPPVHMTPKASYLTEPHGATPEPDKVTVKKATAKQGGGYLVTVHHGGTFNEILIPRANGEEAAKAMAVEKWKKSRSPEARHKSAVSAALQARKHVPPEVANDYPDLVQRYGNRSNFLPDASRNRVPGSELHIRATRQPKAVQKAGAGKFRLDIGDDPRKSFAPGDVIDVQGKPHVITSASDVSKVFGNPEDRQHYTGNSQTVQARPLSDAEQAIYDTEHAAYIDREEAEKRRPLFQD